MNVYALIPMILCVAFCCAALFFLRKNLARHTCLCTVILTLFVSMFLLRQFLLGNCAYLYAVGDGPAQYLPLYTNYIHILRSCQGLPWWTFSIGFGAVQGYDTLLYPLHLPPILMGVFFGETALMISLAWMQCIKMALAAFFMYLFLQKLKFDAPVCAMLSFVYALCGIITLRGHWIYLGDECYLAAMILWSAECYFREKKWYFIPCSIFLLGLCMGMYYLYLYGLLLLIYGTARYICDKRPLRQYPRFLFACCGFFLLGAMALSFLFIGFNWKLFTTARFSATTQQADLSGLFQHIDRATLLSGIFSLFDTNAAGAFDLYSGTLNYLERPLFYIGIGCLYFIPQGLILGKRNIKLLMAFGLSMAAIYMLFPGVTDLFNAFIYNSELGARTYRLSSLWIVIMMIVMAAYGCQCGIRAGKFHTIGLLASAGIYSAVFLLCCWKAPGFDITLDNTVVHWCWLFLIGWPLLLYGFGLFKAKCSMTRCLAILLCFALLEMGHSASITYRRSAQSASTSYSAMVSDPLGFYGDIPTAIAHIQELDPGFYRISGANTYTSDAIFCAPLYFGTHDSSYYTNIDANTYAFLEEVYPESFINGIGSKYSVGVGGNLPLSTLTGYRYCLTPTGDESEIPFGYEYLDTVGDIQIWKNTKNLSIGLTYDTYVKRSVFEQYTDPEQQLILLGSVVLEDDAETTLRELTKNELDQILIRSDGTSATSDPLPLYTAYTDARQESMLDISQWTESHILGTVSTQADQYLVFSIPNVPGWRLTIDGEPVELQESNIGFIGAEIPAGTHSVELFYRPKTLTLGLLLSLSAVLLYLILLLYSRKRTVRGKADFTA